MNLEYTSKLMSKNEEFLNSTETTACEAEKQTASNAETMESAEG